jgi:hypothetical protein
VSRQPDPAASRAVLIGVADYAEPERWEALPAVRTNVEDLRALLCAPDSWGLPEANCTTLVDPRERVAVLEAISEAAEAARDTVFVYYCGHGATTEEDLLFTLSSTSSRNLGYSAVEFAAVRRVIQARRATHAVIVLDCCFSGKAHAMADPQSFIDTQISTTSAYTLTSSARNSISLAPPGKRHTAFTGELLRVLREGSPYAGPLLTLADMTRAVSNALADKRMPTPRYSQSGPADLIALVPNRAWSPPAATASTTARPGAARSTLRSKPSEPPAGRAYEESRSDPRPRPEELLRTAARYIWLSLIPGLPVVTFAPILAAPGFIMAIVARSRAKRADARGAVRALRIARLCWLIEVVVGIGFWIVVAIVNGG